MRRAKLLPAGVLLISLMLFSGTANAFPIFSHWGKHGDKARAAEYKYDHKKLKKQKIRGTVTRVSGQVAYVRTSPGRVVAVRLGPEAYWEERGYRLVPGERVTVVGWYDPYVRSDLFFAGSIFGPGFSFSLTNGVGAPLWVTNYDYVAGWYPTYDVYETWYQPTYRYVRVTEPAPVVVETAPTYERYEYRYSPAPPPGHVIKGGPRGYVTRSAPPVRHVVTAPPPAAGHVKKAKGGHGHGGPRGK